MKNRAALSTILLLVLTSLCYADGSEIRVMSFNIRTGTAKDGANAWPKRKEFLVDTIKAFGPDLLGTQETQSFQRDYLAEQLPEYGVVGVGRTDGKKRGEMMAVYFRKARFEKVEVGHFWLSETPNKVGSKSWDSSLPRMVTWLKLKDKITDKPVVVMNTHFDHRGPRARLESARMIRERATAWSKEFPVIVMGDFNAGGGSDPYKMMFGEQDGHGSPLRDTYRVVHPKHKGNEGTFNAFGKRIGKARIDWIAVTQDWGIVDAQINRTNRDGVTPSDHYPVTAILNMK